jgi:1-phosphofructokinase
MIYTVTFNPSLDYIVSMNDFQLGKTNRTTEELILPGGKGLNVSTVLHNLGIENTALGFTAGFVGEEIKRLASAIGYGYDFIDVQNGNSRINVKLKDFDGTEINGMGPEIDGNALNALMEKLRMLKEGDTLILAGSIPASMPKSIYSDILKVLDGKGIDFVVDATKELLLNVLQYHPFLIKPNNHELGELFGVKLEKKEQIEPYARKLQELGARNVLVSMAGEGAVLLDESGNLHQLDAPKGKLVNAVGAGDSMVAGFLAGWIEQKDYLHAFKMAVCAGSASAFSEGYAKKEEVETLYRDL